MSEHDDEGTPRARNEGLRHRMTWSGVHQGNAQSGGPCDDRQGSAHGSLPGVTAAGATFSFNVCSSPVLADLLVLSHAANHKYHVPMVTQTVRDITCGIRFADGETLEVECSAFLIVLWSDSDCTSSWLRTRCVDRQSALCPWKSRTCASRDAISVRTGGHVTYPNISLTASLKHGASHLSSRLRSPKISMGGYKIGYLIAQRLECRPG